MLVIEVPFSKIEEMKNSMTEANRRLFLTWLLERRKNTTRYFFSEFDFYYLGTVFLPQPTTPPKELYPRFEKDLFRIQQEILARGRCLKLSEFIAEREVCRN